MVTCSTNMPHVRISILVLSLLFSCATSTPSPGQARGLLRFDIEPPDAEILVDDAYLGRADGWADGVIPTRAGARRVEIRADGFLTQRFDIEVRADEEVTLRLKMERTFADPAEAVAP